MIESSYTAAVNKLLRSEIYVWKVMNSMQNGIPDCYYSGDGGALFAEYKYLKTAPKRESTEIIPALSKLQDKWLTDRHNEGRSVCVILGSPQGAFIFTDLTWKEGITPSQLTLSRKDVAQWILQQTKLNF